MVVLPEKVGSSPSDVILIPKIQKINSGSSKILYLEARKASLFERFFCNTQERRKQRYEKFKREWQALCRHSSQKGEINFLETFLISKGFKNPEKNGLSYDDIKNLNQQCIDITNQIDSAQQIIQEIRKKHNDCCIKYQPNPSFITTRETDNSSGALIALQNSLSWLSLDTLSEEGRMFFASQKENLLLTYRNSLIVALEKRPELYQDYKTYFGVTKNGIYSGCRPDQQKNALIFCAAHILIEGNFFISKLEKTNKTNNESICEHILQHFIPLSGIKESDSQAIAASLERHKDLMEACHLTREQVLQAYKLNQSLIHQVLVTP